MSEMRSSDPSHFSTTHHAALDDLGDRPPPLSVIRVNLDGVLYTLHAALAYFRAQDKDESGWRGKFVATGSNACVLLSLLGPLSSETAGLTLAHDDAARSTRSRTTRCTPPPSRASSACAAPSARKSSTRASRSSELFAAGPSLSARP